MFGIARGKQIMLDRDLAKLYQCKNGIKKINQAIKRNIARFPKDFCFQLTLEEYFNICSRSQIVTLNKNNNKRGNNLKYYAFTEI